MELQVKDLSFRSVEISDGAILKEWLMDPVILHWFPMVDEREVDELFPCRSWDSRSLARFCMWFF